MKKSGFTLAEVLITLGIIGVVAALTAPQLITNSKNNSTGAKVATAISTLENAFQTAMLEENKEDASDVNMIASNLAYFGKYLNAAIIDTADNSVVTKSGVKIKFSNGVSNNSYTPYSSGSSIEKIVKTVDIYTDPTKKVEWGRNVFRFYLDKKGTLYPHGGKDMSTYGGSTTYPAWSDTNCKSGSVSNTCAGRLVDEGYKIDY